MILGFLLEDDFGFAIGMLHLSSFEAL
jgi:hypothetical protein